MKPRIRGALCGLIAGWLLVAGVAPAQNGIVLEQDLDANSQGYTVIRVWGSHYEMGYAQANLLGDYIVDAVDEIKVEAGSDYSPLRALMAVSVWQPPELEDEIEDELDGMVASLLETHPSAGIDKLDLKVINTFGDWDYACRSHMCWGRYVAPPIQSLATRRLDFGSPAPTASHHVLLARDPDDGSPRWVNLAWPGAVAVVTGVNEFGTLASLHDYHSSGADLSPWRMPRAVAARHALTLPSGSDPSTHLTQVFLALQLYEIMTGSFVNYYTPEGHGGVMTAYPYQAGPDFYHLRVPQAAWHHGEAMVTTNRQTDGTTRPVDEDFGADAYYDDESPKTLESHWDLLENLSKSLHQLSVAHRGRGDMTLWADGRVAPPHGPNSRTPRLEWEWAALFPPPCDDGIDNDEDGFTDYPADPGCRHLNSTTETPRCQDGLDNDGKIGTDFDGGESVLGVGNGDPDGPDPQCLGKPWRNREAPSRSCGLGAELMVVLPLVWLHRRRRRALRSAVTITS